MRDTSENMIEILEVFKEYDHFFCKIQFILNDEILKVKFGIIPSEYSSIKKILEFRPFDYTGVAPYKYF